MEVKFIKLHDNFKLIIFVSKKAEKGYKKYFRFQSSFLRKLKCYYIEFLKFKSNFCSVDNFGFI